MNFPTNPNAELLLHFNDNVEDSSGNNDDGSATAITYVASGAGATSSGFGKAANFEGGNITGGDSYALFDNVDLSTGDFTIEFWVKFDDLSKRNVLVCTNRGSAGSGEIIIYHDGTQSPNPLFRLQWWTGSQSHNGDDWAYGSDLNTTDWFHMAVVRTGTTHALYVGKAGDTVGDRQGEWVHTAYPVGDSGYQWVLGRLRSSGSAAYNFDGQMDEFYITKEAKYSGATYDIPTAPYLGPGDLFTINNITYKYNNPGWEIHGTTADTITTDCGVIPFAGQSAAPAAIPRQTFTDTSGIVTLFHFDDNLDDSSVSGAFDGTAVGSPTITYQTSAVSGSGFNKQIDFPNGGGATGTTGVSFPDPGIGTGAFTFECWFNSDLNTAGQCLFTDGGNTGNGTAWGDVALNLTISNYTNTGTGPGRGFEIHQAHASGQWHYVYWGDSSTLAAFGDLWSAGGGMKHIALVRAAASGGNSQWRLYLDGNYIAPNNQHPVSGSLLGNLPTVDMGGQDHWMGRTASPGYYFNGQMDEYRITKSEVYTGTGTYIIPTAPFSDPTIPSPISGKAQLYGKEIAGVVTTPAGDICLHAENNLTDDGSIGATVTAPGTHNSLTFDGTNKKFGTHSMYFDANSGADSFVLIPYSAGLKFEGDYTVDFWVKLNADSDNNDFNLIIGPDRSAGGSSYRSGLQLGYYGVNGGHGNAAKWVITAPNTSLNGYEWALYVDGLSEAARLSGGFHHIAIVRDSSGGRFYFNGVKISVESGNWETTAATVNPEEEPYLLGRRIESGDYDTPSTQYGFDGWIDEFRIVKGSAEWTANFTPPTVTHGPGPNVTKIYAMNSAGVESPLT